VNDVSIAFAFGIELNYDLFTFHLFNLEVLHKFQATPYIMVNILIITGCTYCTCLLAFFVPYAGHLCKIFSEGRKCLV